MIPQILVFRLVYLSTHQMQRYEAIERKFGNWFICLPIEKNSDFYYASVTESEGLYKKK